MQNNYRNLYLLYNNYNVFLQKASSSLLFTSSSSSSRYSILIKKCNFNTMMITDNKIINYKLIKNNQINNYYYYLNKLNYCQQQNDKPNNNRCWNCNVEKDQQKQQQQPSCHQTLGIIFCDKCKSIQEMDMNLDYFKLMGFQNRNFSIDQKELTQRFRRLQGDVHPDKFGNKTTHEQNLSADWSSFINSAYKCLLNPLTRAEYILKNYHNIIISEDNSSVEKEFLMEMMERNEEVDEAKTIEDFLNLYNKLCSDRDTITNKFQLALANNELTGAKENFIILRYFTSLEHSIKDKATKLGFLIQ